MAKMSIRRKLAIATWSAPREGNIYGKLTVDATEALRYLDATRERSGEKVSITHLVGVAVGRALARAPGLNGRILWGRYLPHDRVDLAFLVALEEGENLAATKVCDIDRKSVADVARELRERAQKLRSGKDEAFNKSMAPIRWMPTWLIRIVLWVTGWLTSSLGISAPGLGLTKFPFGSCVITSVGMFGLDEGFAPQTPFARVPVYVLIGALRDLPAVIDGQLAVRKQLTLCATVDHRFLDGYQGGVLAKVVRSVLEDPWQLEREGEQSGAAPAAASG
jgi:pyruvate dehydrogenase E2 component (dihydrolipoamide acetyltransferase)